MRALFILLGHLLTTIARLLGSGGGRAIVAESVLLKQQLLVVGRSRHRAPNFSALDRLLFGFWSLLLGERRIPRVAIILRPSTLLSFHDALKKRKYRLLYTPQRRGTPGPKGPSQELIQIIVEMKRRNPRFGYPRIAQQIAHDFGIDIDKDVVRRVLAKYYDLRPGDGGPSWLTFLGHMKDSLWSMDLFRCESMLLRTHWVMVIMDQFTRRIIGFSVHVGDVDGVAVCRMFNEAVALMGVPRCLSTDNDPLFEYHRWQANLRILGVEEIKTVAYVPLSHPFVERLVGTTRREFLDQTLFWNAKDLERKLGEFKEYYNEHRAHASLGGGTPAEAGGERPRRWVEVRRFRWQAHCRGLYKLPMAA
ncbi:MAG: integrase core domain-containing protein [Deltaproteobacteria bacterium]|nr:integrase core domain-containing protein [Deltaproteobacteria bacterium]